MTRDTVLIIEDDAALRRGLSDNLRDAGYRVQTAADGEAGFTTALTEPPDLILLDIMLPGMNGFEICRRVRAAGLDMPIIMLTAKGQEEDIVRGLNLGADDYVTKPFSVRELRARVEALLRRRHSGDTERFGFGDCELDTVSARLTRAGSEVELTPKEYKLLAFFAARPERALTRDEIMDAVWGRDLFVTPRSVDRCITTLRAKIETDPRRPRHIRTIREIGYRFES